MKASDADLLVVVRVWAQEQFDFWMNEGSSDVVLLNRAHYRELIDYLDTLSSRRVQVVEGVVRQHHDKHAGYLKYIGVIETRKLPKPGIPVKVLIEEGE